MLEMIGGRCTDNSIQRRHYIPPMPGRHVGQGKEDASVADKEAESNDAERRRVEATFQSDTLKSFFNNKKNPYFDSHEIAHIMYLAQVVNVVEQPVRINYQTTTCIFALNSL